MLDIAGFRRCIVYPGTVIAKKRGSVQCGDVAVWLCYQVAGADMGGIFWEVQ